ncbi:hypothetical protein BWQ96_05978 [Gracilariopsis chorda]|uniref:Uncharacterized protein n=1 Tax=Gracilariopsis chorda TaxID=448386 RepID=A0A2V3IQD4_9FLOR|nr:hypothetical protein BWQ96_05978 [Gracilariopsis chorda]|eukprot:PXF44274.1 hypothetical protein BWQ96_05978 [Gracilariopsis chorda]
MRHSDFVHKLYQSSQYLDHFTDILEDESYSTNAVDMNENPWWLAPVAIRYVEGILRQEVRVTTSAQRNIILSKFKFGFGDAMIRALKHARFDVLCPLISDQLPDVQSGRCMLWDPKMPFTALRFGVLDPIPLECDKVAQLQYEGTQAAIARRSWAYMQSRTSFLN